MSEDHRRPAMGQLSAGLDEEATTGTTIVGGQPPRRKHVTVNVPVGVERALFLAAGDPIFGEELLQYRDAAVRARGLPLRDSEAALLRAAPAAQLRAFMSSLDVSPVNVRRRAFLGAVAASAAGLAAGGALGCSDDGDVKTDTRGFTPDAGVRDQMPQDGVPVQIDSFSPDKGIRDQMPVDLPRYVPDAGILPDTAPADVPVYYPDAGVPVDVPVPQDVACTVDFAVPLDVPWPPKDAGILPGDK